MPLKPGQSYPKGRVRNKHNPELKRARALKMLQLRIDGTTTDEIARRMNCCHETVERETKALIQEGILDDIEHKIIEELVPKAQQIYAKRMGKDLESDDPDIEAATNVLKGIGLFGSNRGGDRGGLNRNRDEDTLEGYFRIRKSRPVAPVAPPDASVDPAIDAEIVPEEGTPGSVEGDRQVDADDPEGSGDPA